MSRINYWGNSKLADWLRKVGGAPKMPAAATSEQWVEYKRAARKHSKFLYWLADDLLDSVQDVIYWPKDKLDTFSYWVYNRFIEPTHTINTKLKKGQWHETEEKLLHGMFEELVSFVEGQCASMNWSYRKEHPHFQDKLPYFIERLVRNNNRTAGLDYLLWETSLKVDEDWGVKPGDDTYGDLTGQAEGALEILDLYVWWMYIRPTREDSLDASGYTEYFDRKRTLAKAAVGGDDIDLFDEMSYPDDDDMKLQQEAAMYGSQAIEERYDDEDEEMMIRLIKVRKHLWT